MKPLAVEDLPGFISSAPITVVFVSAGFALGNQTLLGNLAERYGSQIAFGVLPSTGVDVNAWWLEQLRRVGLPDRAVLPGYYLLRNGTLLGWHPGSFEQEVVSKAFKWIGVGVGVLEHFLGGKSLGRAISSGFATYEFFPAAAAFQFFSQLLDDPFAGEYQQRREGSRRDEERRQRQDRVVENALDEAYRVIGMSPSATDEALRREYKRLSFANHPDRARDPSERARREEFMKRLNQAYGIIAAARGL